MNGRSIILIFFAVFALIFFSCRRNVLKGEGKIITQPLTASDFDHIEVKVPVKAIIKVQSGIGYVVSAKGYENIVKHIKVKVENHKLIVNSDLDETWRLDNVDELTVNISLPALNGISLSGASDAVVHGLVTGDQLKLDISGSSDVNMDSLNTDHFFAVITGAADIEIGGGSVKTADYNITGAGTVKAFKLRSLETKAEITGAGEGEIDAEQKLDASISGAGSIRYKGHPSVNQHISGAGSLSDAN